MHDQTDSTGVERFFPLAFICFTAAGGNFPWMIETPTPAFSNTWPSCRMRVRPPPPCPPRSQLSSKNFLPSIASIPEQISS
ncbi:hypothetical protein PsorP6_006860 [Peronosclerospora sorghi]|uniref:Uncharacterized protein n=1 Tax=Peronosclerospora sorghi TaxID=230839 RepID=A0ACC0W8E2_9STRA|nr:hypothetical protein PsorP6_006860 [Peronosclerospora sorghi]